MVNELEQRIGDALRADAATVRPESIPGVPPRPLRPSLRRTAAPGSRRTASPWSTRGRVLVPLAAAAAVAATVVGLTVARPLPGSGRPAPGAAVASPSPGHRVLLPTTGSEPLHLKPLPKPVLGPTASRGVPASAAGSGAPRYYVTVWVVAPTTTDSIVVRDTTTGKVTGRMTPPEDAVFASVAATAGDRTFLTAITAGNGCTTQLYQFSLNSHGQPGPLVPLNIALPLRVSQGGGELAITPDGRTIGYDGGCGGGYEGQVGVIDLARHHVTAWSVPAGRSLLSDQIQGLSLSADGRLLGYEAFPDGMRVLDTHSPAGSVFAHSQAVPGDLLWGAVSADGHTVYGCARSPGIIPASGPLTYTAVSLANGHQHVIAHWASLPGPQCWADLDPAGNYLLVEFPTTVPQASDWSRPVYLDIRTGRLISINAPAFYGPLDVAW
jgi:hypothetical protein